MTTYADLVKKHANMKRCKPKTDDPLMSGCGQMLDLESFASSTRVLIDGTLNTKWAGWCRGCQRVRDRHKAAAYRSKKGYEGKRQELIHSGPTGIERLFFCDLPATEVERVNRYTS